MLTTKYSRKYNVFIILNTAFVIIGIRPNIKYQFQTQVLCVIIGTIIQESECAKLITFIYIVNNTNNANIDTIQCSMALSSRYIQADQNIDSCILINYKITQIECLIETKKTSCRSALGVTFFYIDNCFFSWETIFTCSLPVSSFSHQRWSSLSVILLTAASLTPCHYHCATKNISAQWTKELSESENLWLPVIGMDSNNKCWVCWWHDISQAELHTESLYCIQSIIILQKIWKF